MTKPTVRIWRDAYSGEYDLLSNQRGIRIYFKFSAPIAFPLSEFTGWHGSDGEEKTMWSWWFDATDHDPYDMVLFAQMPTDVMHCLWVTSQNMNRRLIHDEPVLFRADPRPWFDENVDMLESDRIWMTDRVEKIDKQIADLESEKGSLVATLADFEEAPA